MMIAIASTHNNRIHRRSNKKQDGMALLASERSRDVARTDMALNLTNLFQAGKLGVTRSVGPLPVQQYQGMTVRIKAPALDARDQDVLFAILALALKQHSTFTPPEGEKVAGKEVAELEAGGIADNKDVIRISVGTGEILGIMGVSRGGKQIKELRESLDWLSMITIRFEDSLTKKYASSKLIYAHAGSSDGRIDVFLSWRLTTILMRSGITGGGGYIAIAWEERRKLRAGVSRLVHTVISSRCPGSRDTSRLSEEEILRRVFRSPGSSTKARQRQKHQVRSAIREIKALPGWS